MVGSANKNDKSRLSLVVLLASAASLCGISGAQADSGYMPPIPDSSSAIKFNTPSFARAEAPVMIIRFNEKNVYFRNPLKSVVAKISSTKPDAVYALESVAPAGATRNEANDREFDENLRSVINVLNTLGVPVENIKFSSVVSDSVKNQEVKLYIR